MMGSARTEDHTYDGFPLYDLHNQIWANRDEPAHIAPVPVIDECATCRRKDTLRPVGGEWKRREWLCEKCGCVTTDRDLDRLYYDYMHEPGAMDRITPTVRSLLVESAYALFRISQGDADALESAGHSARRLIRMIEWGGPSEDWFAEAE